MTEADHAPEPVPAPRPGSGRLAGSLFGAITVIPAMLAAAWLLPGLPLVLANRFTTLPMVFMFAPLAVGLCYFAVRQLPASWPTFRPERPVPARPVPARPAPARPVPARPVPARPVPARPVPWWALAGTVAVAVAFAAWQIAERTEQI
ncbi:MAG: hypothetical protein M3Z75_18685, partial [Actinomycetota bacterium]|nr:hypothetical protein [Actinomycetota bacterium]